MILKIKLCTCLIQNLTPKSVNGFHGFLGTVTVAAFCYQNDFSVTSLLRYVLSCSPFTCPPLTHPPTHPHGQINIPDYQPHKRGVDSVVVSTSGRLAWVQHPVTANLVDLVLKPGSQHWEVCIPCESENRSN